MGLISVDDDLSKAVCGCHKDQSPALRQLSLTPFKQTNKIPDFRLTRLDYFSVLVQM